jgi:FHA domain
MPLCPNGHQSATDDYCDQCGAIIGAAPTQPPAPPPPPEPEAKAEVPCPGCGAMVEGRFCESCGYDVEAGVPPAAPATVTLELGADRGHWERMVGSGEPAFPSVPAVQTFELAGDRAMLGRVRSGAPVDVELALVGTAADPAVSHHQCEFTHDPATGTWSVRDAGSANGTWINGGDAPLAEGENHLLADGDRILVGAWTCLTVRVATAAAGGPGPAAAGAEVPVPDPAPDGDAPAPAAEPAAEAPAAPPGEPAP